MAHESLIEKLQGIQVKAFGKRRTAVEILDELTEDELSVWFKAMLEEGIQEGKIL